MTEIRKQSYAADSLMNAKHTGVDDIWVPLDYNYGRNFDGPRTETRSPDKSMPNNKKKK